MKYLIAVPCMEKVDTLFMTSLLDLKKPENNKVAVSRSSLVYDSRNKLTELAVNNGFDRILWLDSDMVFEPDTMLRLAKHLDDGLEFVCGMYFSRKPPIKPCIYSELREGNGIPEAVSYTDYPKDTLFEIAGAGFGCVMVSVDLIKRILWNKGAPFIPLPSWGEDLSFCIRAKSQGARLWCDSSIKIGHLGQAIINESAYQGAIELI